MVTVTKTFEINIDSLHDVLLEIDGLSRNDTELLQYFDMLPEQVRKDAFRWGMDDTCVRDAAYMYFQINGIK